jgi:uncharacterized protein YjbI with pentapeptide repeats
MRFARLATSAILAWINSCCNRGGAMGARFLSWWKQIKTHPITAILISLSFGIILLVLIGGYKFNWAWTGFNGTDKTDKTLYDWMQLLFIPVVLAIAGFWFNHRERKSAERRTEAEREIEQQRAKAEQELAFDNQQETALQEYFKEMSELLLHEKLRESQPEDEVRKIGRVRTLTILPRLNYKRKRTILRFLYEASLIDRDKRIVDLSGADLSYVYLMESEMPDSKLRSNKLNVFHRVLLNEIEANMNKIDLSKVNMYKANLHGAELIEANLSGASLYEAEMSFVNLHDADLRYINLTRANLEGANLSGADLRGANLVGSVLSVADLSGADLRGAYLWGAILNDAELSNADLGNADMSAMEVVDLSEAQVDPEQLAKAKSLKGATMPNGDIHE